MICLMGKDATFFLMEKGYSNFLCIFRYEGMFVNGKKHG